MADTFFGFDSSLNNGDHLLPPDDDDCVENEEEEYDALNDETFGALEDSSGLDDWEQQHEQFAEIAESSKHSDQYDNLIIPISELENEITQWMLEGDPFSYQSNNNKNGDIFNSSSILSNLQKASKSFIETRLDSTPSATNNKQTTPISNDLHKSLNQSTTSSLSTLSPLLTNQSTPQQQQHLIPKQIRTVEELEKNLLKSSTKPLLSAIKQPIAPPPHPQSHQQHGGFPPNLFPPMQPGRLPPGLPPLGMPPPGPVRHMPGMPAPPPPHHHYPMPPGLMHMLPPHFMQGLPPRQHPPGLIYPPGNPQFPVNHPYNFPPPPRHMPPNHLNRNNLNNPQPPQQHHQQQQKLQQQQPLPQQQQHPQQQRQKNDIRRGDNNNEMKDEYAGLMTNREKQWLLNIQMLQLNTGTPYFDDYYYTVFKERKSKANNKENNFVNDRSLRYPNNRQRNNDRQENSNTLTPRVYTPLQFENSLGKLQCGSVTAPRKIIDMDIVIPEKDSENPTVLPVRDTRKTKQLLLELEALFTLLLKAEDLRNPLAISNMEKLREIKQKQRLRELELAPTPEQKQEVLKLFKQESEPIVENPLDYINKIVQNLLQDEKFASFLNIRKGKMLLLRLLPHLTIDNFVQQLLEMWCKVLLSIPIVGRRDTSGDHILPKLHPFFKRYIQSSTMSDILEIVSGLVEVVKQENNSRSTPLSHQGRVPLYFVLLNKFGVSALVTLFIRTEYLISSEKATEKQQNDWSNFLVSWSEQTLIVSKIAIPIEPIPIQIFTKHCNRFENLTTEKKQLLEKHFVDSV